MTMLLQIAVRGCALLTALIIASKYEIGHFCTLADKLAMQGSGMYWWADVTSGNVIIAYYVAMLSRELKKERPARRLLPGLLSGFLFSVVANLFHVMLDDSGSYPHWSFVAVFLSSGGHSLYTFVGHLQTLCAGSEAAHQAIVSAKLYLLCLVLFAFPIATLLTDSASVNEVTDLMNKFTYNGFVFLYVTVAIDGSLRAAKTVTGMTEFGAARLLFPLISAWFLCEGFVVPILKMDGHLCAHFLVLAFVALMNSGIAKAHEQEQRRKASTKKFVVDTRPLSQFHPPLSRANSAAAA